MLVRGGRGGEPSRSTLYRPTSAPLRRVYRMKAIAIFRQLGRQQGFVSLERLGTALGTIATDQALIEAVVGEMQDGIEPGSLVSG